MFPFWQHAPRDPGRPVGYEYRGFFPVELEQEAPAVSANSYTACYSRITISYHGPDQAGQGPNVGEFSNGEHTVHCAPLMPILMPQEQDTTTVAS